MNTSSVSPSDDLSPIDYKAFFVNLIEQKNPLHPKTGYITPASFPNIPRCDHSTQTPSGVAPKKGPKKHFLMKKIKKSKRDLINRNTHPPDT